MSGPTDGEGNPTLKVMRLYKPMLQLGTAIPLGCEHRSKTNHSNDIFALTNNFILPDSFGNIYLGETFCSYISVINHFLYDMKDVGLTAKLQTPSVRVELNDTRHSRTGKPPLINPTSVFPSGESLDMVVEHVLAEVGVHTLRVGVTFTDNETGEQKSLRKFYRFNVLNPLTLSFKHTLIKGVSYVEAQLQNMTQTPLFVEKVTFQPNSPFTVEDLSAKLPQVPMINGGKGKISSAIDLSLHPLIQPEEIFQRVYRISDANVEQKSTQMGGAVSLGRVDIVWKTTMGETGRLQTQSVVRKNAVPKDVDVTIVGMPPSITIGCPHLACCIVKNQSSIAMNLQLQLRRESMSGVFASSFTCQTLGQVLPGQSTQCQIELMPLVAGLHEVKGVVVVDLNTSREYIIEKVLDIIVDNTN